MGFSSQILQTIESLKFKFGPHREIIFKEKKIHRTGFNADSKSIEDSMKFRKNRLEIAKNRRQAIWTLLILICVIYLVIFPFL